MGGEQDPRRSRTPAAGKYVNHSAQTGTPLRVDGRDPKRHGVAIGFEPLDRERARNGEIDWVGRAFLCDPPGVLDPPLEAADVNARSKVDSLDLVILRLEQRMNGAPLVPARRALPRRTSPTNSNRSDLATRLS